MMQEIIVHKEELPVVMKSGLVHWLPREVAEKLRDVLASQTAHSFIKIKERGIVFNTAEVEGVYTMEEYENLSKVKQGMWQCEYRAWHNKGKRECECKADFYKKQAQARKAQQDAELNREPTDAERMQIGERMKGMRASLEKRGILTPKREPPPPKPVTVGADDDEETDGMPDFID